MSSKSSKRRQRRINTNDEEAEKKTEEIVEASDDNKSTISTDTEKPDIQSQSTEENGDVTITTTESTSVITIDAEETKDTSKEPETITIEPHTEVIEPEPAVIDKPNGKSGDSQQSIEDQSEELEPLVLDVEDPELEFPSETNSDRSSEIDKSPVINRCATRRSQTRHIPTPKTPKLIDYSAETDDVAQIVHSEVRVNVTRLLTAPELIITPPETDEKSSENDTSSMSDDKSPDLDSTNASVFVNYTRNDTNFDISTSNLEDTTLNGPSFLEKTHELSYGATLRTLTGRRGLRNDFETTYRPRLYKSHIDLTTRDLSDGVKKYVPLTPAPTVSTKRKLEAEHREVFKRVKTEESPGILSYFASPFKSKTVGSEIPTSTPKLTAYKFTQNDDVGKYGNADASNVEPKKWCSIM